MIFVILIAAAFLCNHVMAFAAMNAVPSTAKVLVNGTARSFEAYSINESNYFKLDDLAISLKGDGKGFDVYWDKTQNALCIIKNKPYSGTNEEISTGDGTVKNAQEVNQKVIVGDEQMYFKAYTIGSNTYFKLQDIMQIIDIQVVWNNKKETIVVDASMAYGDAPKPLSGFVICVDPGHGNSSNKEKEAIAPNSNLLKAGFVSGTSGSVYTEAEVNLSVGLMLKEKLIAQGATVIMTREGAEATLSNVGRAKLANDANADLAIRIHCDGSTSSQAMGMSMLVPGKEYVSEDLVNASYKIGEVMLNKVIEQTGASSRGIVTRNDLTGFNWSMVPSVLLEMGFMTNPQEDALLGSVQYQEKIADGITEAILGLYQTQINQVAVPELPPIEDVSIEQFSTEVSPTATIEAERILNERINAYYEKTLGISFEEAKWKVKMDMDKPEFTEARILSQEELQSISVVVNKRNRVTDDYIPNDLVNITNRVALRSEAKEAFDRMVSDAQIEGYRITPLSGFRTTDYQRNLYNRYLKRDSFANVETYSARAGFSEHHTGLAIDVGGANYNMSTFSSSREYPWVVENSYKYGFIIRYQPNESNITGYMSEPWHLRYVGTEIARVVDIEGIKTLEEYVGKYVR